MLLLLPDPKSFPSCHTVKSVRCSIEAWCSTRVLVVGQDAERYGLCSSGHHWALAQLYERVSEFDGGSLVVPVRGLVLAGYYIVFS